MKALFIASFFVHLVFMNVTLGGALLAVWYRASNRAGSMEHELARHLSRFLPATLAGTLITGLVPWLALQDYQDNLGYTSYVLGGLPWFSITLLLLAAYYGLYAFQDRKSAGWALAGALSLGAVVMLFTRYHAEPTPSLVEQVTYPPSSLVGALLPRFAHFLVGALAVACGFAVLLGVLERRERSPFSQFAIVSGARGYILFTLIQYLVGLSYLFALPLQTITRFLGGDWVGTALLGTAIAVSLISLLYMHRAATAEDRVAPALKGLGGLAATVLLMILIRDRL
jgi:hypothetical protein